MLILIRLLILLSLFLHISHNSKVQAKNRVALVVSGEHYDSTKTSEIKVKLEKLNFHVIISEDGTRASLTDSFIKYFEKLKTPQNPDGADIGFIYYLGHTINQSRNKIYLTPKILGNIDPQFYDDKAFDFSEKVVGRLLKTTTLNMIFLDVKWKHPKIDVYLSNIVTNQIKKNNLQREKQKANSEEHKLIILSTPMVNEVAGAGIYNKAAFRDKILDFLSTEVKAEAPMRTVLESVKHLIKAYTKKTSRILLSYVSDYDEKHYLRYHNRIALLIGNQQYTELQKDARNTQQKSKILTRTYSNGTKTDQRGLKRLGNLENPIHDVIAISKILTKHGYKVFTHKDLKMKEFNSVIEQFKILSRQASEALIYYAGHGFAVDGVNYIAPTDMMVDCDARYIEKGINTSLLFDAVDEVDKKVIVLDACRNTPFTKRACGERGVKTPFGFTNPVLISPQEGLLFLKSTLPGATASDGESGSHSPFASVFIKEIENNPKHFLWILFEEIARKVKIQTKGLQSPEYSIRGGAPAMCLSASCNAKYEFEAAELNIAEKQKRRKKYKVLIKTVDAKTKKEINAEISFVTNGHYYKYEDAVLEGSHRLVAKLRGYKTKYFAINSNVNSKLKDRLIKMERK